MAAPHASSADDEFVVFLAAAFALTAALGSVGLLWSQGVEWLVDHQLLVAAAGDPVVPVPGGQGAGLDGRRLLVLAGALLVLVAWLVSALRRVWVVRRAEP